MANLAILDAEVNAFQDFDRSVVGNDPVQPQQGALSGYEPDRQDNRAAGSRRRSFADFCGGDLMSALAEFSAPVDKRSLDRAAGDKFRQAIVAGKIAPCARLKEANLALQFQLSRGTVRTALHRLVAEGLVAQRPYSGWQVVSLSSYDAWELYTLRGSLEALAARLAAANMNDTGRHKLWEAFGRLKTAVRAKNDEAITDADFAIHKMIVDLAGHKRLAARSWNNRPGSISPRQTPYAPQPIEKSDLLQWTDPQIAA